MSKLEIVNDAGFHAGTTSGAVLVEFSSPSCAPCRLIEPVLERMADEFKGKVQFLKVNVNDSPMTTARFHIRSVPTMLFMSNGSVTDQLVGAVSPQTILEKLRNLAGGRA